MALPMLRPDAPGRPAGHRRHPSRDARAAGARRLRPDRARRAPRDCPVSARSTCIPRCCRGIAGRPPSRPRSWRATPSPASPSSGWTRASTRGPIVAQRAVTLSGDESAPELEARLRRCRRPADRDARALAGRRDRARSRKAADGATVTHRCAERMGTSIRPVGVNSSTARCGPTSPGREPSSRPTPAG